LTHVLTAHICRVLVFISPVHPQDLTRERGDPVVTTGQGL
jgi:hypothetical protein